MSSNPSQAAVPEVIPGQLSLREYFVAHAPEVPGWFEPELPEVEWPDEFRSGSDLGQIARKALAENWSREHAENVTGSWLVEERELFISYLTQYHVAKHQSEENVKNRSAERSFQWPLYWADNMIRRLNK
ncbi:hypothetical protein [Pseudomonas oryzihabitans]|uniref:hypothetical protein n=1 Tax=Pseudomonas oryzihabitans TaxID=47885 RepID=UPI0028B1C444|nr:hypothetical protein [Pseudomonas oryzihabitans]